MLPFFATIQQQQLRFGTLCLAVKVLGRRESFCNLCDYRNINHLHFWNRNYKEAKRNKENEKPDQGGKAVLPLTKGYSSGKEKIEKGKVKKEKWEKKIESEKIKVKVKT